MINQTFCHALLCLLMISAAAISVTASSSGGGLRRIRFGSSNSPYTTINESVLVDDEAFGHIEDISDTEDFFRRLGGSSMMSMTSKSSSEDEANVISNDDAASHVAPTASIAATSAPTTKRPTILGVNPPIAAELDVPTPSMAPMPSLPVPTMTPSSVPTPSCNLSNDERYDELQKELGVVSMSDLTDMSTPQGKAFNWIVSLDEMQLCPGDDRLIQRYVVVALYFSTNGDGWKDKTSWLNAATECEWAGLTCNLVGEIVSVELNDNNLGGAVPMELGGLLVAESIELHNNSIQSPIPTSLCDNTFPLGELGVLTSDCAAAAGVEPLVECSCCTQCY